MPRRRLSSARSRAAGPPPPDAAPPALLRRMPRRRPSTSPRGPSSAESRTPGPAPVAAPPGPSAASTRRRLCRTSRPPTARASPRLKQQIQPRSVTSSCSVHIDQQLESHEIHQRSLRLTRSCSSGLRMTKKKPEQHKHTWTDPEEEALFEFAGIVAVELSFQTNKVDFCRRVAVMMNDRFQVNHQYVPLDADKVRMKLNRFKGYWEAQPSGSKKMYTSSGGEITGRDQLWTRLFTSSEATGSDAGSKKRKSREDTPKDKESAVKYMLERESSVFARQIFAAALSIPNTVTVFCCLGDYLSRRKHLIDLWKGGCVKVPELEGIPPSLLPADFW